MKGFLFVLRKELLERRLVFPVALTVGLVPWVLPWLLPSQKADDLRLVAAAALALGLQLAVACATGASTLTGDLATGRLGFLFSLPISERAIWAGKLGAALLVSVGAGLLTLLPTVVPLAVSPWSRVFLWSLLVGLPATLLLVFLAAALAIAERARSAWLVLDLAVVAATAGAVIGGVRSLRAAGAAGPADLVLTFVPPAVLVTWLVASRALVRDGRSELDRAHRAFSSRAAIGLGVTAAVIGMYAGWAVQVSPSDLVGCADAVPLRGTSWVVLSGPLRARPGAWGFLLYDPVSRRFVPPLRGSLDGTPGEMIALSGDGLLLATLGARDGEIWRTSVVDLGTREPAWTEVPIWFKERPQTIRLSFDGTLLAAWQSLDGGVLTIHETATGRPLATLPLDVSPPTEMRFVDLDRVLMVSPIWGEDGDWSLVLHTVSISGGKILSQRETESISRGGFWLDSRNWMVGTVVGLYSATSGELERPLSQPYPEPAGSVMPWQLSPGLLGTCDVPLWIDVQRGLRPEPGAGTSCFFWRTESGSDPLEVDIEGAEAEVHGQVEAGAVLVSGRSNGTWNTWKVNALTGETTIVGRGLRSIAPLMSPVGSPATSLYLDDRGGLVRLEPSGERTLLLSGHLDPGADLETWPYAYSLDWLPDLF